MTITPKPTEINLALFAEVKKLAFLAWEETANKALSCAAMIVAVAHVEEWIIKQQKDSGITE